MTSSRSRTLLCGLLLLSAACDDPTASLTPEPQPPLLQIGVSEPTASAAAPASAATVSAGLAYLAFAEGELGDAVSVTIGNATTSVLDPAPYAVHAGALDPVAIAASIGDTIQVAASYPNDSVAFMRVRVPAARPPRIIRTSPTKGRTDVALNAKVVVVFSEPIDPTTISTATVRLTCDGTPVSGGFWFGSATTTVALVPEQPLPPDAVCKLLVAQDVADLSGDALEEPVEVEFRTGDGDEPEIDEPVDVDLVVIVPHSDPWLDVGETAFFTADAYKNDENVAIHFTWTSSDTSVVSVSQTHPWDPWGSWGQVRGIAPGTAEITAAAGGQTARIQVTVSDPAAGLGSITGWIRDAATGSPPDHRVRIRLQPILSTETYFQQHHDYASYPGATYQEDGSFAVDSVPAGKRTIYLSVPYHFVYSGLYLYADTAVTVDVVAGETAVVPEIAMRPLDQRILLVEVARCPWALPDEDHMSCDSYPGGVNVRLEVVGVDGSPTAGLRYEGSIPDNPPPFLGTWDDNYFSTHFSVAVSGEYDVRLVSIPSPWQLSPGSTSTQRIVVGQGVTALGFHFWFK